MRILDVDCSYSNGVLIDSTSLKVKSSDTAQVSGWFYSDDPLLVLIWCNRGISFQQYCRPYIIELESQNLPDEIMFLRFNKKSAPKFSSLQRGAQLICRTVIWAQALLKDTDVELVHLAVSNPLPSYLPCLSCCHHIWFFIGTVIFPLHNFVRWVFVFHKKNSALCLLDWLISQWRKLFVTSAQFLCIALEFLKSG